jgi:hypothetical protein
LPSPPELFIPTHEVLEAVPSPHRPQEAGLLDNINQFPPEFFADAGLERPDFGDQIHSFPPGLPTEHQPSPVALEAAMEAAATL